MEGRVIRYARQAHGLTQNGLAQLLKTTQLTVCRWETDNQKPQPRAEKKIKLALGLTESDLIEIEELLRDEKHKQLKVKLKAQAKAYLHEYKK